MIYAVTADWNVPSS